MTMATSCGNEKLAKIFKDTYPDCWQAEEAPKFTFIGVIGDDLWSNYAELL